MTNLGTVAAAEGAFAQARELHQAALAIRRQRGDVDAAAYSVFNLGNLAMLEGRTAEARTLLEESLAAFEEIGDRLGIGYARCDLGWLAHGQRDASGAARHFATALTIRRELGDRRGIVECLEGLAAVAIASGQAVTGVELFAAAAASREELGAPIPPCNRTQYDREVAGGRAALSDGRFQAAWAAGGSLSLEAAVDRARGITGAAEPAAPRRSPPADGVFAGLTPREQDVLRLVAAGHSDREIAAELFVSPRTVGAHVASILDKLDVPSRAAAAAHAARHGLV